MNEWILESKIATGEELAEIQQEARHHALGSKTIAWKKFSQPLKEEIAEAVDLINRVADESGEDLHEIISALQNAIDPVRKDIIKTGKKVLRQFRGQQFSALNNCANGCKRFNKNTSTYTAATSIAKQVKTL